MAIDKIADISEILSMQSGPYASSLECSSSKLTGMEGQGKLLLPSAPQCLEIIDCRNRHNCS